MLAGLLDSVYLRISSPTRFSACLVFCSAVPNARPIIDATCETAPCPSLPPWFPPCEDDAPPFPPPRFEPLPLDLLLDPPLLPRRPLDAEDPRRELLFAELLRELPPPERDDERFADDLRPLLPPDEDRRDDELRELFFALEREPDFLLDVERPRPLDFLLVAIG